MIEVRDSNGNVKKRSKNLRGLIREIGLQTIEFVKVWKDNSNRNRIFVKFDSGDTCQADFASLSVLINWVRTRRNLKGVAIKADVLSTSFAKRHEVADVLTVLEFRILGNRYASYRQMECNGSPHLQSKDKSDKNENAKLWEHDADKVGQQMQSIIEAWGFDHLDFGVGLYPTIQKTKSDSSDTIHFDYGV